MEGPRAQPPAAPPSAGESNPPEGSGLIFVCDASAEAERLMTSLRARGYTTIDVPLGLLSSRVRYQVPELVVCDADAPEALARTRELRGLPDTARVRVIFLGSHDGALQNPAFRQESVRTFARPLDFDSLCAEIEALLGPPSRVASSPTHLTPRRAPAVVASARKPYRSDALPNTLAADALEAPPPPSLVSADEPLARSSLMPSASPFEGPLALLSPETRLLLERAHGAVSAALSQAPRPTRLSSDAGGTLQVSLAPDVLAALHDPLDELLDGDLEGEPAGTAGGISEVAGSVAPPSPSTGPPPAGTSAALDGEYAAHGEPRLGAETALRDPLDAAVTNPGRRAPSQPPPPSQPTVGRTHLRTSGGAEGTFAADGERHDGAADAHPAAAPQAWPPRPSGAVAGPHDPSAQLTVPPPRMAGLSTDHTVHGALPATAALRLPPPPQDNPFAPTSADLHEPAQPAPTTLARPAPPGEAPANVAPPSSPAPVLLTELAKRPTELTPELAPRVLAEAIKARVSGALAFQGDGGVRRVVLRDGDIVTAVSGVEGESLVRFLQMTGDLEPEIAEQLAHLVPPFGRHAGAALIANGHLAQDDLWPVLRAHSEWILASVAGLQQGQVSWEDDVPLRLQEEPAVFGGAAGAEVFVETLRRSLEPARALRLLGGGKRLLGFGPHRALLAECALQPAMEEAAHAALGGPLVPLLDELPALLPILYALVELGVLSQGSGTEPRAQHAAVPEGGGAHPEPPLAADERHDPRLDDPYDDQALAERIARRKSLVEDADYFELLGVSRAATGHEIDRAHQALRRKLDPARLSARTAHLSADLELILEVLDEAHDVLSDAVRRERYRRALEDAPWR